MPYLEVLNGPEVGQKVPLVHETIFIGRDPNNHLVLTDRTVSRKHAVLNKVEGEFVISDLKSLKGILVNGEKKGEATLEDGDEIAVGAVRIRYHAEGKGPAVTLAAERPGRFRNIFLIGVLLAALGTVGYFLWPKIFPDGSPRREAIDPAIREHFEAGVRDFNRQNKLGARRAWEEVLALDPKHQTPYARKALKLLEKL